MVWSSIVTGLPCSHLLLQGGAWSKQTQVWPSNISFALMQTPGVSQALGMNSDMCILTEPFCPEETPDNLSMAPLRPSCTHLNTESPGRQLKAELSSTAAIHLFLRCPQGTMACTDKSCEATYRYTNLLVGHSAQTKLLFGKRTQVLGLSWRRSKKWKKNPMHSHEI